MSCKNHPQAQATARCAGCAESFCANCVVEADGQVYCGACKIMAVRSPHAVLENLGISTMCREATTALIWSILAAMGLLLPFLGWIFGGIGISHASKARQKIALNPNLAGRTQATVATIVGWSMIALSVLNFIAGKIK